MSEFSYFLNTLVPPYFFLEDTHADFASEDVC